MNALNKKGYIFKGLCNYFVFLLFVLSLTNNSKAETPLIADRCVNKISVFEDGNINYEADISILGMGSAFKGDVVGLIRKNLTSVFDKMYINCFKAKFKFNIKAHKIKLKNDFDVEQKNYRDLNVYIIDDINYKESESKYPGLAKHFIGVQEKVGKQLIYDLVMYDYKRFDSYAKRRLGKFYNYKKPPKSNIATAELRKLWFAKYYIDTYQCDWYPDGKYDRICAAITLTYDQFFRQDKPLEQRAIAYHAASSSEGRKRHFNISENTLCSTKRRFVVFPKSVIFNNENIISHEIGHALGADHDSDGKNLMNPSASKLNKHLTTKSLKEILLIEQDKTGEKGLNLICNYDIALSKSYSAYQEDYSPGIHSTEFLDERKIKFKFSTVNGKGVDEEYGNGIITSTDHNVQLSMNELSSSENEFFCSTDPGPGTDGVIPFEGYISNVSLVEPRFTKSQSYHVLLEDLTVSQESEISGACSSVSPGSIHRVYTDYSNQDMFETFFNNSRDHIGIEIFQHRQKINFFEANTKNDLRKEKYPIDEKREFEALNFERIDTYINTEPLGDFDLGALSVERNFDSSNVEVTHEFYFD